MAIDARDQKKHNDIVARSASNAVAKWKSYAFGTPLEEESTMKEWKETVDSLYRPEIEMVELFDDDELISLLQGNKNE